MANNESLGIGLYSLGDASRLLKIPRPTVDSWVRGYVRQNGIDKRIYPPVLRETTGGTLTFGDLVELMYVRGFREGGVPLQKIRLVANKYGEMWHTPYPLATKKFATAGKSLLLQEGGEWQDALNGQILAFDDLVKTLVHAGDLASEWRPLGVDRAVTLNPDRAFGKPIETNSGAHTYVLAQALAAGDKPSDVAWWYGIPVEAVKDAAQFESEWAGVS